MPPATSRNAKAAFSTSSARASSTWPLVTNAVSAVMLVPPAVASASVLPALTARSTASAAGEAAASPTPPVT
jgi:hypothetical protein